MRWSRPRPFIIGVATGRPLLLLLSLPLRRATRAAIIGGWKTGIVPRWIMSFRAHACIVWWNVSCGSHVAEPDDATVYPIDNGKSKI
jgi:hypothetical protein